MTEAEARDRLVELLDVSRETLARLDAYADLLAKWNPHINLVSRRSLGEIWSRHILDSAQVFTWCPQGARLWLDLGSGGGLPGAIVAIIAYEKAPDLRVICVESDQRKATFLRTVFRETGVKAEVIAKRIEDIPAQHADVVSARALAPLKSLISFAGLHLAPGGCAIFPKGAGYRAEIAEAREKWAFDMDENPSETERDAAILVIGGIERV